MTLLVAWTGADYKKGGNKISSLYLASDSRISWGKANAYDHYQKVYGSNKYPDLFGFCGDVTFPTHILSQLISQIDNNLLFKDCDNADLKHAKVFAIVEKQLSLYPVEQKQKFTILHASRHNGEFKLFQIDYNNICRTQEIILSNESKVVFAGGSGGSSFTDNLLRWKDDRHNNKGTTRGVYHCLIETLERLNDFSVGKSIQLIGLYRINNARIIGTTINNQRYLFGKEVEHSELYDNIEWRNEKFERISSSDLKLLEGAQIQPF
ncbi:hypothetical protein [Psychrobacter maritimus]|uniref:hypothetical protein n=1 Tax=Psychrobacter maritimus TaxID=256325 RepID=UPI001919FFA6|nr:hypothetical protein [Psychrobacter maritimus]